MRAFRYTAVSASGQKLSDVAWAASASELRDRLLGADIHPLSIRPALKLRRRSLSLSGSDAALLANSLARLLKSGLSMTQALQFMGRQSKAQLVIVIDHLRAALGQGQTLSRAFAPIEGQPARFLEALARAAEASGRQGEIFSAGGTSLARTEALRRRLITLSLYPAFVMVVALGSIAIYVYTILPSLEPALSGLGDQLPAQTAAVLTFGSVMRVVFPALAVSMAMVTLIMSLVPVVRRVLIDRIAITLIRIGLPTVRDFVFSGLAARLSVMIRAGVPLATAWRLSSASLPIESLRASLEERSADLMQGARLSRVLERAPGAPRELHHLVMIGEQSGQIAHMLDEASTLLGERAQSSLERALAVMTPLVIVLVGLLVGVITLMVFQGLLAVGDAVTA